MLRFTDLYLLLNKKSTTCCSYKMNTNMYLIILHTVLKRKDDWCGVFSCVKRVKKKIKNSRQNLKTESIFFFQIYLEPCNYFSI